MTRVAEGQPLTFGDRLAEHVLRRESNLVLGLDPDPARLWPRAVEAVAGEAGEDAGPPAARAAMAVSHHCDAVLAAAGPHCVAVKFQVACFERLGSYGWAVLERAVTNARAAGLLVIADAKRGDIDVSAAAYAQAFFGDTETPWGTVPGLGADALTVNPFMGSDTLAPFVDRARAKSAGLFVLTRTSNPGAADLQEREVAGAGTVTELVGAMVRAAGADGVGAAGVSDVGAVVGATAPHRLARLRELMPATPFLIPGVGAQGGQVEDLAPVFSIGPAGGLVSASRSIVDAHRTTGNDPAAAAAAEAERLRILAWAVAGSP